MAFHLGCLRALYDQGILDQVTILSTVSGGSVIGALYTLTDEGFPEFEKRVRTVLQRGLVRPTLRAAFLTREGPKALWCWALVCSQTLLSYICFGIIRLLSVVAAAETRERWKLNRWHPPVRRFASRTTIFRRAMDEELFKGAGMDDIKRNNLRLIISAAELRTGSAFYFSAKESGSWRLGKLARSNIALAYAVAASAAYPLFLPAIDDRLIFKRRDGSRRLERVTLTDGGVYDNLGLAPLWPDRDPAISLNVTSPDVIICCNAGYGLRHDSPTQFLFGRLTNTFACIHDRAQNAAMKRLFDLKESGKLGNFVIPYLGQDDSRLKCPPVSLVTREEAYSYPTDFYAMSARWIQRLSDRGEQLTRAVITEHAPELIRYKEKAVDWAPQ